MKPNPGRYAELSAREHLEAAGLRLRSSNYRCRVGEIDLVMQDGPALVFVEVRLRSNGRFGSAADSVDFRKRRRLILAAQHYLQSRRILPPCRFDVVAIDGSTQSIDWIKGAFDASS